MFEAEILVGLSNLHNVRPAALVNKITPDHVSQLRCILSHYFEIKITTKNYILMLQELGLFERNQAVKKLQSA